MRILCALIGVTILAGDASAQIRVNPTGVNVNGQGATTTFLTFGRLQGYVAAEAVWCGDLLPASAGVGPRCDPATIYGSLPARYDRSQLSGNDAFTDIMSIPPSVARRAYQAAAAGKDAEFFYVRRFTNPAGGSDQYVAVTCRLTGGGARVPLSLTDVQLAFDVETPILQVQTGATLPKVSARIAYTGTGRLKGRWEIVLPGQELPTSDDLLTEATLPVEQRGTQRRFAEIDRFNVFLEPTGRYTLPGPQPSRLPTGSNGQYLLLLRVEASDDKEGDSDLSTIGAGTGVVHSGAVAGFPMPVLRYVVGSGGSEQSSAATTGAGEQSSTDGSVVRADAPVDLGWLPVANAQYSRVEVEVDGKLIHQAFVAAATTTYRLPPFVVAKAVGRELAWRVVAIDAAGHDGSTTAWRRLKVVS